MSKELITALNALEKENGISKEVMLDTIEKSLKDEFKNQFNTIENCEVVLDRITGDFHIYANRTVVDTVTPAEEMEENRGKLKSLYMARKFHMQMLRRLSLTARLVMY